MLNDPPPSITSIALSYVTGEMVLTLADGTSTSTFTDPSIFVGTEPFESTEVSLTDGIMDIRTRTGESFVVELAPSPRRGRPVVYLDQNHWIFLARALNGKPNSSKISQVAERVVGAVENGNLILPLSSAHHVETGYRGGASRQRLAVTMLTLSRGWVMKHPLRVRREELHSIVNGTANSPEVISTIQWSLYDDPNLIPDFRRLPFPGPVRFLIGVISSVMAAHSYLLDAEGEDVAALKESSVQWAHQLSSLAKTMAGRGDSSEQRRRTIFGWILIDMIPDLYTVYSKSARDPEAWKDWLSTLTPASFEPAPYLRRWLGVFQERLTNPQQPWEANDLVDLLHLPCAVAYCDAVVAERNAAHYLNAVERRIGGEAIITSRLEELPDILDDLSRGRASTENPV